MGIFWARFSKNPLALTGIIIVLILILVAIFAPWLAPYNPLKIDTYHILEPPCAAHWFGTDALGRDCLSRIIYGARISLMVGFVAVGLSTAVGTILGAIAGYFGGWVDSLIMRAVDVMLCFPTIFLIMAVIAFLQPSIINIMVVIGLTSWMGVARLVRAEFLSLRQRDFVKAAKLIGMSPTKIIFSEILPNAVAPILVSATLGVGAAILTESALSFLGIGVQPPTPSWGNMLTAGKDNLEIAWWLSVFPGLAILITVLGFNLLGEGLRDALDPRLQVKLKNAKKKRLSFKLFSSAMIIGFIILVLGIRTSCYAKDFIISQNNSQSSDQVPLPLQKIPTPKVKIGPQQVTPAWQIIWNRAREMAKQGDLQGAIALYQELLNQRPGLVQARWELAQLLAKTGQKIQAVNLIEQYLEARPTNLKAKLLLADLLVDLKQYDRAKNIYLAIKKDFESKQDKSSLFYIDLQLANIAYVQNNFNLCLNYLLKAKQINKINPDLNLLLAYCLQSLGEDQKALRYFKKIETIYLTEPSFLKHYALCLIENDKINRAIEILNLYLKKHIGPREERWAQRQLIRLYLMNDDETDAIKALETWLKQKRDPFLERRLARLYFANHEYLKALNTFEYLLDLYPNDLESLGFIGRIYILLRLYRPAINIYQQLLRTTANPDIRFTLIELYYFTKQYKKALDLLNQEVLPKFFISLDKQKELVTIYIKNKKFDKAKKLINNLLSFYPNNADLFKSLLLVLINTNQLNNEKIKTIYDVIYKLICIDPNSHIIKYYTNKLYNLGYKKLSLDFYYNIWNKYHNIWIANRIINILGNKNSIHCLVNFLKILPNNLHYRLLICYLFAKQGDFNKLKEYFPNNIGIFWYQDFNIVKALAFIRSGYLKNALNIISSILSNEPNNLIARESLYYLYQEEGMIPNAINLKEVIKILNPQIKLSNFSDIKIFNYIFPSPKKALENPKITSSLNLNTIISILKKYGNNEALSLLLAISYAQRKQINEAITSFEIFIKNYPLNLAARLFYAKWLIEIGCKKKAINLTKTAIVIIKKTLKNNSLLYYLRKRPSLSFLFENSALMWRLIDLKSSIYWLTIFNKLYSYL